MHCAGNRCSRRILKTNRIKREIRIENVPKCFLVEIRIMRPFTSRRQFHERDTDLMLQAGIGNRLTAIDQIVDVIEGIKISDGRHAMLFEQFRMQIDDIAGLGIQAHHIHATGQGLQICIGPRSFAEAIHHLESIFLAIKVEGLETRTPTRFEVANARIASRFQGWKEIRGKDAGSVDGLESIAEGGTHELNFFLTHHSTPSRDQDPVITDHNTPAAIADPNTPATFGAMACINRKLSGSSFCPTA